jgi:hypothetical protein
VAIDRLFERARRAGLKNLSAAVLDFMVPEFTLAESAPHQRLAADCVLALAVTHHLLLTQGYDYDTVLRRIREYTASLASTVEAPEAPPVAPVPGRRARRRW